MKTGHFKLIQEVVKKNSCQLILINFLVQTITVKIMFILLEPFWKGKFLNVVLYALRTKIEYRTHISISYTLPFEF